MEYFERCEICGKESWEIVYRGSIRDGAFGKVQTDAVVGRCGGCGVERLSERYCLRDANYENSDYRRRLEQELDIARHNAAHDHMQKFALDVLWPESLRAKTIADIGCAAGSLIDHVRGLAGHCIGVEPDRFFHDHLRSRGIAVYEYAHDAAKAVPGSVDQAFSLQVIEHTENPRQFLADILAMLKPQGLVLVSTPNRRDILRDLLPDDFSAFFFRTVHRWYFDADSLGSCARLSGFEVVWARSVHRYGLSNAMAWLRDRKPTGWQTLPGIVPLMDAMWQRTLEQTGRGDCLFMLLRAPKGEKP